MMRRGCVATLVSRVSRPPSPIYASRPCVEGNREFVKRAQWIKWLTGTYYLTVSSRQHLIPSCNGLETMPNVRWNFEESNAE